MKVYRNVSGSGDSLLVVNKETLTGSKVLTVADIVIQWLDPGGASRYVTFPAEADSLNLMFWIYNNADGAGENLVVKNDGGIPIAFISPGMIGIFSCDGTNWKRVNDTGISYDAISGDIVIGGGRVTFPGGTNDDGIVFGNLGTANIMIDGQNSGLSGVSDYWLYFDANNYWNAGGVGALKVGVHASFGSDAYGALLTSTGRLRFNVESNNDTLLIEHLYKDVYFNTGDIATWKAPFLIGDGEAIGFWNGDGVSNGTATITDVGGAAHGLSLAAGDLVHIQDCTTSADEGFYRIVSDDGTSVVLDRALTGSDTDLTVIFYKDVIGLFATDGTNGQRIMNYSHQDKPLQIGGDTLAATSHSLGSEDVLIGGKMEVKDGSYFLGRIYQVSGGVTLYNDQPFYFGEQGRCRFLYETKDADACSPIWALPNGTATDVPILVVGDQGIIDVDLGWFNGQTIPRIAMVAADEGGYFAHGVDDSDILDILATTAPVVETDETKFSHKLQIVINGVTYYVMLTQS